MCLCLWSGSGIFGRRGTPGVGGDRAGERGRGVDTPRVVSQFLGGVHRVSGARDPNTQCSDS